MTEPILRATLWKSNAELIEACHQLGWLKQKWSTLDPTYGKGIWWKNWKPNRLTIHDVILDGTDFRNLPYEDKSFKQITFDPPYVSVGGRKSSKIKEFYERFGLLGAPTTPALLQQLINDGLTEMHRLCKDKGIVLVKCQNYVSSGQLHPGVYLTLKHAESLGFVLVDELHHVRKSAGPQPKNRTRKGKNGKRIKSKQKHARGNVSVLLVLRKDFDLTGF
jgi:hypothetical protein